MGCCNHGNTGLLLSPYLPSRDQTVAVIPSPHLSHTTLHIYTLWAPAFIFICWYYMFCFFFQFSSIQLNMHALCSATDSHLGASHNNCFWVTSSSTLTFWRNSRAPHHQQWDFSGAELIIHHFCCTDSSSRDLFCYKLASAAFRRWTHPQYCFLFFAVNNRWPYVVLLCTDNHTDRLTGSYLNASWSPVVLPG